MMIVPADYDGAWKEALERYLRSLLELCFPAVAALIDWSQPFEWLDKELQEVVRGAELGKQFVDKLVKVFRLDGIEEWLLIHLEVQSQTDRELPERIYQYHHRIRDRFGRRVVSLVVLGDKQPDWCPNVYEEETWGCRLRFEYLVCKLLQLGKQRERLDRDPTPAAVIVASHLAALESAADMPLRERLRWELTVRLHEHGYSEQDTLELLRLVDWLLPLPEEMTREFRQKCIAYEEEKRMPHVTSFERIARQECACEDILAVLDARFGEIPYSLREQIQAIRDEPRLRELLRSASVIPSLESFQMQLQ